jgi:hypothetical protein
MHYVCFHYEFEHHVDPDQECSAGGCPSGALGGGRDAAAATTTRLSEQAKENPNWENVTLTTYLEAFGAWLEDCSGYYANQHRVLPGNAWMALST